ncbi:MAG: hypothetical protein ACLRV0_12425 [Anaerobutyricum soehngenii]
MLHITTTGKNDIIVPFAGTGIKIFAVVFRGARASYPSWVWELKVEQLQKDGYGE